MRSVSKSRVARRGFTLIELMVAAVIVAVAIVGVMGGIRSLGQTDVKARKADLLQRLAMQELDYIRSVTTVSDAPSSGDFTDAGYPGITFQVEVQPTGVTNLESVKITVTQGKDSQSLTELMYQRPTTTGQPGATTGATP